MKPVDVKLNTSINSGKKLIIMILNLKLVIFREYQNTKIFLQKVTSQIPLKKFLWPKTLKTLFTKNNCKKRKSKKSLEFKNWWKEKAINYVSNGKVIIIHLIFGLIKKT